MNNVLERPSAPRQTSLEAYRQIESEGLLSKLRWEVYAYLFAHGPCTAKQVTLGLTSGHESSGVYNTRLSELRDLGVAQEVGQTVCEFTGRRVIVWDVTPRLPQSKFSLTLPVGRGDCRVGIADNPWHFENRHLFRKDNPEQKARFGIGASGNYNAETNEDGESVMRIPEICELGEHFRPLWTDDAYLFLWVPASIDVGGNRARVFDAWGFQEINYGLVWVKVYDEVEDEYALMECPDEVVYNPGHYIPNNVEIAFFGRRKSKKSGMLWHPKKGTRPRQVVVAPRARYPADYPDRIMPDGTRIKRAGKIWHSRKPEEVQDRIEQWLFPHLEGCSAVELFATRQRPGWTCFGHELSGLDIRDEVGQYLYHNDLLRGVPL